MGFVELMERKSHSKSGQRIVDKMYDVLDAMEELCEEVEDMEEEFDERDGGNGGNYSQRDDYRHETDRERMMRNDMRERRGRRRRR